MECEKEATGNGPIQHQVADIEDSSAAGRKVLLSRLMAFVLAIALLLLPVAISAPHVDAGGSHGQQTRIEAGKPVLVLSNHDNAQTALRSDEASHSGKSTGTSANAALAFAARLPEPDAGRLAALARHDAAPPQQRFLAFLARAPPRLA